MATLLRTEVNPAGFTQMLERLGRDCSPLQFVREYVQNSIEAIQRTGEHGEIFVDANWDISESSDVPLKLSFIDNGIGMTAEELVSNIKDLSSSGDENEYENYGMGAKIASITRNKAGILYESWKKGTGSAIVMHYDADEKAYGLLQHEVGDGTFAHVVDVEDYLKPDSISDHGTRVTLFGRDSDQSTMEVPEGVIGTREAWIYNYINQRYYDIPDFVTLKVRIGAYRDRSNTRHNYLRQVYGQRKVLEDNKLHSGSVQIPDASVHWYILKDKASGHGREYVKGHTAALHQREIFDKTDGRSNRSAMFGVIFGAQRVVLIIEPDSSEYVQNTSRTGLIDRLGNALPWETWADEFRKQMPQVLQDFITESGKEASGRSHDKSIRERLKSVRDLYKISRFRIKTGGTIEVDEDTLTLNKTGHTFGGSGSGTGKRGSNPGSIKDLLTQIRKPGGPKAEEVKSDMFPDVRWVSISDGTRESDEMVDRAATYYERDNLIKANRDFQGYTDIIEVLGKQFADAPNAGELIADVVYEVFEQQLVEVVTGALSFKGRKHWTSDDFDSAVSDEALTAAVMVRYYPIQTANRQLKQRLQKLEAERATAA